MNPPNPSWEKLVAVARRAGDDRLESAPYGFATRVAALAMAGDGLKAATLFERWSLRAVAVAGLFAVLTVATNYSSFTSYGDDDLLSEESTMAALFD